MLELIIEKLPELEKLESTVAALELAHGEASARVQALAVKTATAREADLDREAAALNSGRKVPNASEPGLREQLEGAGRDGEVLERRLRLAEGERARYISEHHGEILAHLGAAHAAEGERVAAAASEALAALAAYHGAEDAARNLQRLHPAPAQENVGGPQSMVTVWGNLTTRNYAGGPQRGDLEGTLQYLISLGAATVVGAVEEGDDDQDAA
jgi:hypothetical protein